MACCLIGGGYRRFDMLGPIIGDGRACVWVVSLTDDLDLIIVFHYIIRLVLGHWEYMRF